MDPLRALSFTPALTFSNHDMSLLLVSRLAYRPTMVILLPATVYVYWYDTSSFSRHAVIHLLSMLVRPREFGSRD